MKKSILIALVVLICLNSSAQDLRCVYALSYLQESQSGEINVKTPITVCYYGKYFSFYTKNTGVRTFEVSDVTTNKDDKGYVVESFMNAENKTNMHGDYDISITYGIKKVIVINFTRFGQAYIIETSHFIGSPYENTNTKALATRLKTGKAPISTIATSIIDVEKRVNDSLSMDVSGQIKCLLQIADDGHITNVKIENILIIGNISQDILRSKIENILKEMPNWVPAIDNEGKYEASQLEINIKLTRSTK